MEKVMNERRDGAREKDGEANKISKLLIIKLFGKNSTGASQLDETQIQSYPIHKYMLFLWFWKEAEGEEGNGGQAQCLIHLMP